MHVLYRCCDEYDATVCARRGSHHEKSSERNSSQQSLGALPNPGDPIQERTSGSAILDRLTAGYLGESPYLPRRGGHAEGKRANAQAAKITARQARIAVKIPAGRS